MKGIERQNERETKGWEIQNSRIGEEIKKGLVLRGSVSKVKGKREKGRELQERWIEVRIVKERMVF